MTGDDQEQLIAITTKCGNCGRKLEPVPPCFDCETALEQVDSFAIRKKDGRGFCIVYECPECGNVYRLTVEEVPSPPS
ncbi:hypothetical protein AKJ57_03665 [candidate division MSBL1 archaeon SCGC-AAA259A05]|uniref:Uncharacterized protein n=1 Tax=candidate division MSBL1 archaeon SCGC-AAA259A05 TaxID=1698259 RepID=A0A133U9D1_9EURY|nr:hypothetical protein AKJ57_03665 [candidate division MSBL1 archaeon SCGC-AAA259A05]